MNISILLSEAFSMPLFSEIGLGWGGTEIYMFESDPDFVEKENVGEQETRYKSVDMLDTIEGFITSVFQSPNAGVE